MISDGSEVYKVSGREYVSGYLRLSNLDQMVVGSDWGWLPGWGGTSTRICGMSRELFQVEVLEVRRAWPFPQELQELRRGIVSVGQEYWDQAGELGRPPHEGSHISLQRVLTLFWRHGRWWVLGTGMKWLNYIWERSLWWQCWGIDLGVKIKGEALSKQLYCLS